MPSYKCRNAEMCMLQQALHTMACLQGLHRSVECEQQHATDMQRLRPRRTTHLHVPRRGVCMTHAQVRMRPLGWVPVQR